MHPVASTGMPGVPSTVITASQAEKLAYSFAPYEDQPQGQSFSLKKNDKNNIQLALSLVTPYQYVKDGIPAIPEYADIIKSYFIQAIADYYKPITLMATVWLNENEGIGISDFVEFIQDQFKKHPINNGRDRNGNRRFRSRGEVLIRWFKEVKEVNENLFAEDCYSDSGRHYHVLISYDTQFSSDKVFILNIMERALDARIIKPYDQVPHQKRLQMEQQVKKYRPCDLTGFHKIKKSIDIFMDALDHFSYAAKQQTKVYEVHFKGTGGTQIKDLPHWKQLFNNNKVFTLKTPEELN